LLLVFLVTAVSFANFFKAPLSSIGPMADDYVSIIYGGKDTINNTDIVSPTILLGALPLIKHKCQWNTDTL
jgi:hypothetical protein